MFAFIYAYALTLIISDLFVKSGSLASLNEILWRCLVGFVQIPFLLTTHAQDHGFDLFSIFNLLFFLQK